MNFYRLMTLTLTTILACSSVYADEQGTSAPPWVKAGTRIVYLEGAATIPNVRQRLVPGGNGMWTVNGQNVKAEDVTGSGGAGYTVIDVGHVEPTTTSLCVGHYGLADVTRNLVTASGIAASGNVAPHWVDSTYWHDPQKLAQLREGTVGAVTIVRMRYPMGNREYNAVRIVTVEDVGGSIYTYDSDSGLLLFSSVGYTTTGMVVNPGGTTGSYSSVSTNMAITRLAGVRDVKLPWTDMAAPEWVGQVKWMQCNGDVQTLIPNAMDAHQPSSFVLHFNSNGRNWAAYDIRARGQENKEGAPMVTGSGQRLGIFLPPAIIPQLRKGQVLDEDRILGLKLFVSAADDRGVTLSEGNSLTRTDVTYDRNGMFVGAVTVTTSEASRTITRIQRAAVR